MDFENPTTSIASIFYNKKRIDNIKICNTIIKFADKKITLIAYLNKKQIKRFYKYTIADNKIA